MVQIVWRNLWMAPYVKLSYFFLLLLNFAKSMFIEFPKKSLCAFKSYFNGKAEINSLGWLFMILFGTICLNNREMVD